HGVLLVFGAPLASFPSLAGPEHGRTIPLADIHGPEQLVAVHNPRTPFQDLDRCDTMVSVVLSSRRDHETPAVHRITRWCGGRLAAGGARAAGECAAGLFSGARLGAIRHLSCDSLPARPEWSRVGRRPRLYR